MTPLEYLVDFAARVLGYAVARQLDPESERQAMLKVQRAVADEKARRLLLKK